MSTITSAADAVRATGEVLAAFAALRAALDQEDTPHPPGWNACAASAAYELMIKQAGK